MKHKLLSIHAGDVVTPVHAWTQASGAVNGAAATLDVHAHYTVAHVTPGYSGAFVTLRELPADKFPAHLFALARRPAVAA